jgi:hypothetical protein
MNGASLEKADVGAARVKYHDKREISIDKKEE